MIYKSIPLLAACTLMTSCIFNSAPNPADDTTTRISNEEKVYSPNLGARFNRTIYMSPKGEIKWNTINSIELFSPSSQDRGSIKYYPEDLDSAQNSASFFYESIVSPDKKWVVLPVGRKDGFTFCPANQALAAVGQGLFQGRFSARTANGTPLFHEFIRWESPSTFVFAASGDEGNTQIDEIYKVNLNTGSITQSPKARTTTHVSFEKNQ